MTTLTGWWAQQTLEDRIWLVTIALTLVVLALFVPLLVLPDFPQETGR